MSILNTIRGQLRSVIEWENASQETLFALWSENGDEIKNASKLIVKPGQGAIFVYQGKVEAVHLQEGLYTLATDNIPFITTLMKVMQSFESEHKVGIYFFWQTEFLDQKWGTQAPIKYNDPIFNFPVGLRARGNFSFKLKEPQNFFANVVGSQNSYPVVSARTTLMNRFQEPLVDAFAEAGYSYTEIDRHRSELSKLARQKAAEDCSDLGFELTDFRIESTDFDDDTERRIDRIADMTAEAESYKRAGLTYAQAQQLEALREAARNEGGVAGLGVGVGAGLGLGNQMAQQFMGIPQAGPVTPPGSGATENDPVARLSKLKELLEAGLISEEEFSEKKAQILANV